MVGTIAVAKAQLQWGSEIRPFEIRKHSKSGLFESRISNGPVFKWSGFSYQPFEIQTFLSGFQMVLTKWRPFVRISNGWASGFQIPFKIQTICNPTCFGPFEIQTRSDFRSPLYLKSDLKRVWISNGQISDPHCILRFFRVKPLLFPLFFLTLFEEKKSWNFFWWKSVGFLSPWASWMITSAL